MTADQVRRIIDRACIKAGSRRAFARMVGISAPFLCDVLLCRREPSGKLLDWFGLERCVKHKVCYRPKS